MREIKIKVIGIGGSGGNTLNRMNKIKQINDVELIALNSDLQDLKKIKVPTKLQIGKTITQGYGCGMNPKLGELSAKEQEREIQELLKGAHLVFITCGLGGGTGSGAAPIVAQISKEILGILTIGIVTMPFSFEGQKRKEIAKRAQKKLLEKVDALVVIENDNLLKIIQKNTTIEETFQYCDQVLSNAVWGIVDLIKTPGFINLDLNDIKEVLKDSGYAVLGIGEAGGQERSLRAAEEVLSSPLLNYSVKNASKILLNIFADKTLSLEEIQAITSNISKNLRPEAKIIFGTTLWNRKDLLRIVLIATGLGF